MPGCDFFFFFFFKQKTAYEMSIGDWSSDVCSSDLAPAVEAPPRVARPRRAWKWAALAPVAAARSEERRVGKECQSTCRSRGSPCPEKKNQKRDRRLEEHEPSAQVAWRGPDD